MRFIGKYHFKFLRDNTLPRVLACFGIYSQADMLCSVSNYTMTRDHTLDKLKQIEETYIRPFFCPFQHPTLLSSNKRAIVLLRGILRGMECGLRLYGRRTAQGLIYTIMPESTQGLKRMYKRHGKFHLFS
jgi:hypothetical protein